MRYSSEYLQGVKDGRATLKAVGEGRVAEAAKADLAFCDRVFGCMGSALSRDYIAGLRDFWDGQLKRGAGQ